MSHRLRCRGVLLLAMFAAAPAYAQVTEPRPTRQVNIGQVCARAIDRYCPALANPPQPHNQVLCLKPYRTSLSAPCRAAVTSQLR